MFKIFLFFSAVAKVLWLAVEILNVAHNITLISGRVPTKIRITFRYFPQTIFSTCLRVYFGWSVKKVLSMVQKSFTVLTNNHKIVKSMNSILFEKMLLWLWGNKRLLANVLSHLSSRKQTRNKPAKCKGSLRFKIVCNKMDNRNFSFY